jgi:hypothetical protein
MWLVVVEIILTCLAVVTVYFKAYSQGYWARAKEDKNAINSAVIAQFRAEQTAEVYRQRALMLLRVIGRDK